MARGLDNRKRRDPLDLQAALGQRLVERGAGPERFPNCAGGIRAFRRNDLAELLLRQRFNNLWLRLIQGERARRELRRANAEHKILPALESHR